MSRSRFAAIILAAGEGTRLKSAHPKVLHEIAGVPMIRHVLDALAPLEPEATIVVIGSGMDSVDRTVCAGDERHSIAAARYRRRGARGAVGPRG